MSSTGVDAADEAGGEVVFSSDGLDPLPAVVRPPRFSQTATMEKATLDTSTQATPNAAFQVFCGHVYDPPEGAVISASTATATKETPAERLGRLKQELVELEQELAIGSNQDNPFSAAVQELTNRLAQSKLPTQQELTNKMDTAVKNLKDSVTTPPTTTSSSSSAATPSALEERLRRLESQVGSQTLTSTTSNSSTLESRVQQMEQMINKLDDTKWTKFTHAAKVIRQDLEAATKARTKLHAANKGADVDRMQSLHEELQQLQGMSQHLPAVVQRLQVLAAVHTDATTWASRLSQTEQTVKQLSTHVQNLEGATDQLDKALSENAQQLTANVKALDARLSGAGAFLTEI